MSDRVEVGSDGFVELVDVMGSDRRIVDAARVSYGAHREEHDPDRDRRLIRHMMRERHTSPFEQAEMVFVVRVPMDTWRQWIRHRTAAVNEYSTRYKKAIDSMAITTAGQWRAQSGSNRQGSDGFVDREVGEILTNHEMLLHRRVRIVYDARLEAGVAREQARKDLLLSTYTEAYWKIDLHNLLHFLELRMDPHAQQEIREYANIIAGFVEARFPLAWEAFVDYRMEAVTFSREELVALSALLVPGADPETAAGRNIETERERRDFTQKIERLL